MCRLFVYCLLGPTVCLFARKTLAVVVEESVTPASVQQKNAKFSVKTEKRKDGLIHFTITAHLHRPQYVVAHLEVPCAVKSDTPSFVHETSATFYIAIAPERLADSKFDLSESEFTESGGQPLAWVGGMIYHFQFEAFGKNATPASDD